MLIGLGKLDFRIKANIQTKKSYSLSMVLIQPDYTISFPFLQCMTCLSYFVLENHPF